MIVTQADFPTGAIENGRELMRRIEDHYTFIEVNGHHLSNCYEWLELRKCFEHLAGFTKHREDAERPLLERIEALESALRAYLSDCECEICIRSRQALGETE